MGIPTRYSKVLNTARKCKLLTRPGPLQTLSTLYNVKKSQGKWKLFKETIGILEMNKE